MCHEWAVDYATGQQESSSEQDASVAALRLAAHPTGQLATALPCAMRNARAKGDIVMALIQPYEAQHNLLHVRHADTYSMVTRLGVAC